MPEGIKWHEWGAKAFGLSREEKKPVLLDIFGKWCHWCHRMDEDTYENLEVAREVNSSFIPVRVDTDRRPDINERYNQGGWPTTVFLDGNGNILAGGTYFPPGQFLDLLEQAKYLFENNIKFEKNGPRTWNKGVVTEEILMELEEMAKGSFDPYHGGFGHSPRIHTSEVGLPEPKFPMAELLEFLLKRYKKTGRKEFLEMVEKSLDGMIGGIFDRIEGGFFRYSVTGDWKLPHYEKMLETNSSLVKILSLAYELTGKKAYLEAAEKTVGYLLKSMANHEGGFFASQDADAKLTSDTHIRGGISGDAYYGKKLEERRKLPEPYIDKTVFADLNGKAIVDLLEYLKVKKDKKLEEFLLKTMGHMEKFWSEKNGAAHYFERQDSPQISGKAVKAAQPVYLGLLRDNLALGMAFLEGGRFFRREDWIKKAEEIGNYILENFLDSETPGLFDKLPGGEGRLAVLEKRIQDNSFAATFFMELGKGFSDKAEGILETFAIDWKRYGLVAGEYGLAVMKIVGE